MTRGGPPVPARCPAALPELEFRNGRFALHERRRRSAKNRALQQAGHVVGHVEEPQIEARRDPNGDLARHADLDPAAPRVAQQARELPRVGEVGVEEAEAHVQLRGGRGPEALPGDAGPALLGVQHEDLGPVWRGGAEPERGGGALSARALAEDVVPQSALFPPLRRRNPPRPRCSFPHQQD